MKLLHWFFYLLSVVVMVLALSASWSCKGTTDDPMPMSTGTKLDFGNIVMLDDQLKEASGIEIDQNGKLWAIADRGNPNTLYGFNENGILQNEIQVSGVTNVDWEDLAMDENDRLFVGDFGNNDNDRTDLRIFCIPDFSQLSSASITPQVIQFTLNDQIAFPPQAGQHHYDIEAFIAHQDRLYLFTKDRSNPFLGKTNMYELSSNPGTQEAVLKTSFITSADKKMGAITSADISPDGSRLILLSEERIYLFTDFQIPDFFSGTIEIFELPNKRQYEGVVFKNDCELFLVNEDKYGEKQQLLKLESCN